MALIKCPECKQQISSQAISCPNCGYSRKKKKGCGCISIVGAIFLGIIILVVIIAILTPNVSNTGAIKDDSTSMQKWRSPIGDEYVKIGRIIVQNNIKVCGEYYIREINNGELIIACSGDGYIWDYFVVYPNLDKIYKASLEMESKLDPPR